MTEKEIRAASERQWWQNYADQVRNQRHRMAYVELSAEIKEQLYATGTMEYRRAMMIGHFVYEGIMSQPPLLLPPHIEEVTQ